MRAACVQAVQQAIGRQITNAEAMKIEQRVRDSMVALARKDPQRWRTLSKAQKLTEAAKVAAHALVEEAKLKRLRLQQSILKHNEIETYVADQVAAGNDKDKLSAFFRLLASRYDAKGNATSVEMDAKGIASVTMGQLDQAWDQISPRMAGLLANKEAENQFVQAAYGKTQGIRPEIVKAAKAWGDAMEELRLRWNASGGDTGKRINWGLPQEWSQDIAVRMGEQKFVDEFMTLVDRSFYRKPDGTIFNDNEMREFLTAAHTSIATNGANDQIRAGHSGASVKANRHSEARQIHFKDPDAALQAMRAWSGKSVFEIMSGHVQRMSRDIALIEKFGPNADHAAAYFIEKFWKETDLDNKNKKGYNPKAIESRAKRTANLYNYVAGNAPPPANHRVATSFAALRALLTAAKLGSATITSISDEGTMYLTGHVNNLPMWKLFMHEARAMNPANRAEKRMARRAGLLVNTMLDEVNRFGDETLGAHVPKKIASAVLRASGLNMITEARRRAFSVTMMDAIGSLTRRYSKVTSLDKNDWRILSSKGIDQATWDIWRAATPDPWGGQNTVLTAESIYAVQGVSDLDKARAASKLMAVVMDERDIAVIEPGARERAMLMGNTEAGTASGEIARSFWQFKTFPVAVLMRHWGRALQMYGNDAAGNASKAGYLGALLAMQTVMGAIALEINDILSGRDPRTLDPTEKYGGRNLIAALMKGGSLGVYGDFLFADATDYGRTLAGALGGPMLGFAEDTYKLTIGNARQAVSGEDTDLGAEASRFARGYTPGASLWYTKAATDRIIFHQMQEYFNPGYLRRAEMRAKKTYGTSYWWPQGSLSMRAPDIGKILDGQPTGYDPARPQRKAAEYKPADVLYREPDAETEGQP